MAYNLEPRTIKENLLGLIGNNPHAEPRPANTREECFLADIAENGGGLPNVTSEDNGDVLSVVNGAWSKAPAPSSLPPYTSADNGKGLFLGETTVSVIVIPEQTITAVSGQPVPVTDYDDAYFSSAAQGDKITATYNGNTAELTATVDHDILTFAGGVGVPILVLYVPDGDVPGGMTEGVYLVGAPGTYTISATATASVPSVGPKWKAAGVPEVVFTGGDTLTCAIPFATLYNATYTEAKCVYKQEGFADYTFVATVERNSTMPGDIPESVVFTTKALEFVLDGTDYIKATNNVITVNADESVVWNDSNISVAVAT